MCEPMSIAMGVMAVGGALMQQQAANNAADAQQDAARMQYEQNMEALREQQNQINQQAGDQKSIRALEAMKERGRLRAAAGEMGVTGVSIDKALQESLFNEGTDISTIEANRKNGVVQNLRNMSGAGVQMAGNMNMAESGRVSNLTTGLQIGTGVLGAYNTYEARQAAKTKASAPVQGSK